MFSRFASCRPDVSFVRIVSSTSKKLIFRSCLFAIALTGAVAGQNVAVVKADGIDLSTKGADGKKGKKNFYFFWSTTTDGEKGKDGGKIDKTIKQDVTSSSSHGINAVSTGGKGGDSASSWGVFYSGTGNAGRGGNGGEIELNYDGTLSVSGDGNHGINAVSQGGNGGRGGKSEAAFASDSGSSGNGGQGGKVTVTNNGHISTTGNESYGINAVSRGGVGNGGGYAGSGFVSVGGRGGDGASGGDVTVTNNGVIETHGSGSHGINALSEGGNGGSGEGGLGVFIGGVGGSGGKSGDSGKVEVTNKGSITTRGNEAHGINAVNGSSQGGNSGWGGGLFFGATQNAGNGGSSGEIIITNGKDGEIRTHGNSSHGINAESYSGNGGRGGNVFGVLFGLGGAGGSGGGSSGTIDITNEGKIATSGDGSHGINAISHGGSGGDSGLGLSAFFGAALDAGSGSGSGNITITNSGEIHTSGSGSHGINAETSGGNGGHGQGSFGLIFALAGLGGDGALAGQIDITNNGLITTSGNNSHGINAISNGGNGGNSGWSGSLLIGAAQDAGGGAAGGKITIVNSKDGEIHTKGDGSHGINAESTGGHGGHAQGTIGVLFSLAGLGGNGDLGGQIDITNQGTITTSGDGSHGINAVSTGGYGGNSGWSGGLIAATQHAGNGGAGGLINITNTGMIQTTGEKSHGINAVVTGARGGNGGDVIGALIGVAGKGGRSEGAGDIVINNEGSIVTSGTGSHAINAVSAGGYGGTGGWAGWGMLAAVAGGGGDGGNGGKVTVNDKNTRTDRVFFTMGKEAHAVNAESKGETGGQGGLTVGFHLFAGGSGSGSGGNGGNGDTVDINFLNSRTTVLTAGENAHGLVAKSQGGSGGNGGMSVDVTGGMGVALGLSFANSGGDGGHGGDVSVRNRATIVTGYTEDGVTDGVVNNGKNAYGINAVSNGGDGGRGGDGYVFSFAIPYKGSPAGSAAIGLSGRGGNGGNSGSVYVQNSGKVITYGEGAHAINAVSQGGNGGNGGNIISGAGAFGTSHTAAVAFGKAGDGGAGGAGGIVDTSNYGSIYTKGDGAYGINAESTGGDGGNGGMAISAGIAYSLGSSVPGVNKSKSVAGSVAWSGNGGKGGNASSVTVSNAGKIITDGKSSYGINAVAKGGKGGDGNVAVSVSLAPDANISSAVEGKGGNGGTGDQVTVSNRGVIATFGDKSHGINAESVGGDGGVTDVTVAAGVSGGFSLNFDIPAYGGTGGNGSTVTVTNKGVIYTNGDNAYGINAASRGGNGGNGGTNAAANLSLGGDTGVNVVSGSFGGQGGAGGYVNGQNIGQILTEGEGSHGMYGTSAGGQGGLGGDVITVGALNKHGLNVSVGGAGGNGGGAGSVNLTNRDIIQTTGHNSIGMYGRSNGGNGNTGGMSIAVGVGQILPEKFGIKNSPAGAGLQGGKTNVVSRISNRLKNTPIQGAVSVGRKGGDGGNGENVTLKNKPGYKVRTCKFIFFCSEAVQDEEPEEVNGGNFFTRLVSNTKVTKLEATIYTAGNSSHGMKGESSGGDGGEGGKALAVAGEGYSKDRNAVDITDTTKVDRFKDPKSGNIAVSFAGDGGRGGNAGVIDLTNSGDIVTSGHGSSGMYFHGAGGHGGDGGNSGLGKKFWGDGLYGLNLNFDGESILDLGEDAELGFGGAYVYGTGQGSIGIAISKGGNGGHGGKGGQLIGLNEGNVWTNGVGSAGIKADASGGNGGDGGIANAGAIAFAAETTTSIAIAVGGDGGNGGKGGIINFTNTGNIITEGTSSAGIDAISAGGRGGDGGTARAFYLQRNKSKPKDTPGTGSSTSSTRPDSGSSLSDAMNSAGDAGGKPNKSLISAAWDHIRKNQKPSKGDDALANANNSEYGFEMTFGMGGSGGHGGDGGTVDITNQGQIYTEGAFSAGVNAASIGGDGGNGGDSARGIGILWALAEVESLSPHWATLTNPKIDIGGNGGNGGNGSTVTISNSGKIYTGGNYSSGIFAASRGGKGGKGGTGDSGYIGDLSIGGEGGQAGRAGEVKVTNKRENTRDDLPLIVTAGEMSNAITAISAGGRGGDGGDARFGGEWSVIQDMINKFRTNNAWKSKDDFKKALKSFRDKTFLPRMGLALAWNGRDGADGALVHIDSEGILSTAGELSHGILAMSNGGHGGAGGSTYSSNIGKLPRPGTGGSGGAGGMVDIIHNGDIYAIGNGSHGIVAQSTGGKRGENGQVEYAWLEMPWDLTPDANSDDIADWDNPGVEIGDIPIIPGLDIFKKAEDGNGGTISINGEGLIYVGNAGNTDASIGILAQSISGAEPLVKEVTVEINEEDPNGDGDTSDAVDLDGDGKTDGKVQVVNLVPTGERITSKPGSGKGGDIIIDRSGAIMSPYDNGIAVLLESAGQQGGGNIEFTFNKGSNEIKLSDADDAQDFNGYIIGGSGSDGAAILIRGGADNKITLGEGTTVYSGNYRTIISEDSYGDFSVIGNDTINNHGKVIGNVDLGRGNNTFNNKAGAEFVTYEHVRLGSPGNYLVNESGGLINPYGLGVGETKVDGGYVGEDGSKMRFDVHFGSTRTPYVSTGGTNTGHTSGSNPNYDSDHSGSQNPDADKFADMTAREIIEYYKNNKPSAGENVPDIANPDRPGQGFGSNEFDNDTNDTDDNETRANNPEGSDRMVFTGNVHLNGAIYIDLFNLSRGEETLVISEGDLTVGNDLKLEKLFSSAALSNMDYEVIKDADGKSRFIVKIETDIQRLAAKGNQSSLSVHLDEIVNESEDGAGDGLSNALASLVKVPEGQEHLIAASLDTVHSEAYLSQFTSALFSDLGFVDRMANCGTHGISSRIVNGNCIWGQATVRQFEQGSSLTSFGMEEDSHIFAGGYQRAISENVMLGVSLQYDQGTLKVEDRLTSKIKAGKIGGFGRYKEGPFEFTLGANYGYSWYDNSRRISLPTQILNDEGETEYGLGVLLAKGKSSIQSGGVQLQLAYKHETRKMYIKPFIDLRANYLEFDKLKEKGIDGLGLSLKDSDNWQLSIKPGIEFGGEFEVKEGISIRPHLMLGAIFFNDSSWSTQTAFAGSPGDVSAFNIDGEFDDVLATVEAGIDMRFEKEGLNLKLQYGGKFSDNVEEHSGTVRMSVDF
ncbi:MAG: hypothetical protein ACRBBN_04865 [Methyloligellaceae bacterium]